MSIRDRVRSNGGLFSRLRRYPSRGWVAGVCAGLADYFDWNAKLLRVLFVLALVFGGFFPAGFVYLILWYLMEEGEGREPATAASGRYESSSWEEPRSYRGGDVRTRFTRLEERLRNMEECVASKDFELRRELRKLES